MTLLLHTVHKVLALLLHGADSLLHAVHLVLQTVLLLLRGGEVRECVRKQIPDRSALSLCLTLTFSVRNDLFEDIMPAEPS